MANDASQVIAITGYLVQKARVLAHAREFRRRGLFGSRVRVMHRECFSCGTRLVRPQAIGVAGAA